MRQGRTDLEQGEGRGREEENIYVCFKEVENFTDAKEEKEKAK